MPSVSCSPRPPPSSRCRAASARTSVRCVSPSRRRCRCCCGRVAIAAVRHLAAPQQPLYREFPERIAAWSRLPAIRAAAAASIGTRPVMFVVGYLAVFMIGFANGRAPLRHFGNELLNLPVRWDAGWYLSIVTDGYRYVPGDPAVQQNIVFFPAFPMLMRAAGRLLGGDMVGYVVAGTILSLACFFGALGVSLRVRARSLRRRHRPRLRLAAGGVSVRDLLRRALHRVAVPAGDRRRLLPFLEAAVRPRRRVGAAGRPDAAERIAARAAARPAARSPTPLAR